jgi:mycofactocin precursor
MPTPSTTTMLRRAERGRLPDREGGPGNLGDMENQSTLTDRDDEVVADDTAEQGADVVEELLIEEISIDGMCGVY